MSNTYSIITNGIVENVVVAETALGNNWVLDYNHIGTQYPPVASNTVANTVVYVPPMILSKVAFMERFQPLELAQIQIAGVINPTANANTQLQSATVATFLTYLNNAPDINLQNQIVSTGIEMMVGIGILTQDRANTILYTVPTTAELL